MPSAPCQCVQDGQMDSTHHTLPSASRYPKISPAPSSQPLDRGRSLEKLFAHKKTAFPPKVWQGHWFDSAKLPPAKLPENEGKATGGTQQTREGRKEECPAQTNPSLSQTPIVPLPEIQAPLGTGGDKNLPSSLQSPVAAVSA